MRLIITPSPRERAASPANRSVSRQTKLIQARAPTIWCSLGGLPNDVQRGIVQPFILMMQIATLAYFSHLGILTKTTITSYLACAPAVLFATWLGLRLFHRIDDATFRRVVLIFLIVCGASLLF